ncbi:efflux RND transporter periplasmic adaptor subunit [uncultured Thiodictyon sp.]|uniref:efflux RND transporter periplasmic adaptor subunit n=1 Tax=uncultured Thiodictyon sp. TaxID=1846217 RepID=UPI0025ED7068|nr:efflux RND transporter periplasmic adaptor subunit [uncultured Thiodictyon sp.]
MTTTTLRTALLWLAMAALAAGCDKPKGALFGADQGPPRVVTAAVQQAVLPFERRFPGETLSQKDITLVAPVAGFLDAQPAADGALVSANAPLYRIRRARYQAEVTHAEGALAAAQAQLANAQVSLGRQESLWKNRNTSEADLLNARAQQDQAKAGITQAQADLERARINLADTEISAPFAGQLGVSKVSVGTWLAAGQAVGTLVQLDPIRVRFEVPERLYLAHFADRGSIDRVAVRLRLADGTLFAQTGRIDFFDNRVAAATGTIAAFAILPNPDQRLRPGMYVRVLLERDIGIPSLLIPQAALLNDQLGQYVYIILADGKVQRRNVTVGDPVDERIVVLEGLTAGEQVVAAGLQRLRPGLAVQVIDAAAPGATPPGHKE